MCVEILEWIEYDRFENVEYLTKGGFGTIYKAIWKDGYMDITFEFLREIESHTMIISACVTRCFGITKDPKSNNFMMIMEYAKDEPKNAIDNYNDDDNSIGEYSESIEAIDFTKLNLDKD
ncbi:unnamed protein product [Rhizophagus irregularis]|nr:unnamed protein product [Rhizophagus irregularis]CAB5366169.1 unnamed protein product [Rhizophagus irregularis]